MNVGDNLPQDDADREDSVGSSDDDARPADHDDIDLLNEINGNFINYYTTIL